MFTNTFNPMLRSLARKVLPFRVREVLRRLISKGVSASYGYQIIEGEVAAGLSNGWKDLEVAERQHATFGLLLRQMYKGKPREDFVAAATAVQMTGLQDPLILEVGCGSGYYSEILSHLLQRPIHYVGLDYSQAMICLARECYPGLPFVVGDATALTFADGAFDIVLNGVSLMHIPNYKAAITESRRVARRWCIFHTVPVLQRRETTVLRKKAYGEPTIEVIFNEGELYHLLDQDGLVVRHVLDSIPYNLEAVLGEPTVTKTYVCEVTGC